MPTRVQPKLVAVCLAVSLFLPLLVLPGAAMARPTNEITIPHAPQMDGLTKSAAEWVHLSLTLAGDPVVETYIAQKTAGAGKADLAKAQQDHKGRLAKAQDSVLNALKIRLPHIQVVSQQQMLVNSIIVRGPRGDIERLRSVPGVVDVEELIDMRIDLGNAVPHVQASRVAMELGITGRNVRIAVLDGGADYTHRNYGGPGTAEAYMAAVTDLAAITETVTITNATGAPVVTKMFPTEKIPVGWDFVGDTWNGGSQPVLQPDPDPMDPAHGAFTGSHGSHTSGIALGFGVPNASFNGSIPADNTFGGTTIYHGAAPAAQLYVYKVCSSVSTACSTAATIQAQNMAADPNQDGDMSDHVDVLNMSLGSNYGATRNNTVAAGNAVRAGIAVVAAAGNAANFPYIMGSPSISERVISVANTLGPTLVAQVGLVDAPSSLAGRRFVMVEQTWAPSISATGVITGELVFVGQACPGQTLAADPNGKVALIIRGVCSASLKSAMVGAAGAKAAIIYNNLSGDAPPSFSFGGGAQTIPAATVTQATGLMLRSANNVMVTLSPANAQSLTDTVNGGSSRGPSVMGNTLKPDISAPGTSILSTGAGQGTLPLNNSGTSMSSPLVAGAVALIKQAHPTWSAQELLAAAVNTANPIIKTLLPDLTYKTVPLSWQGAGLLNAYKAVKTTTIAHVDDQVATVNYGVLNVVDTKSVTKSLKVSNKGTTSRTYNLTTAFHTDPPAGTTVSVSPTTITVPAGGVTSVDVTLNITASGLPDYGMIDQFVVDPTRQDRSEIAGFVTVTEQGGAEDVVASPFYAIARKAPVMAASANSVSLPGFGPEDAGSVRLTNSSAHGASAALFKLIGVDPDETAIMNQYDVQYVGVNSEVVTSGGQTRKVMRFGIHTHGSVVMAFETRFNIFIDVNRDGTDDFLAFNNDLGFQTGAGTNGQNVTLVQNLATGQTSGPFYFTNFQANSSNFILPFNASDLGLTDSYQAFNFYVVAVPNWSTDTGTDRTPDTGALFYDDAHPRFMTSNPIHTSHAINVPANGNTNVGLYANARGFLGAVSGVEYEKGALFLYSGAASTEREAEVVMMTFPFNYRVEQKTLASQPSLTGFVVNRLGDLDNQLGSGQLWTGVDNRGLKPLNFHGVAHFSLGSTGAQVEVEEASLDLTGHDASYVDARLDSRWWVHMLSSSVDVNLGRATYQMIAGATADATLTPTLSDSDLGVGQVNSFMLDLEARKKLAEHVRTSGGVTFRTTAQPQYNQGMHLFAWDGRTGGAAKSPTLRLVTVTRLP